MIKRIALVSGLWLSFLCPCMAQQQKRPIAADLQVDAETIGSIILGKKVKLMLCDSSYLEGKVLRAGREEIELSIAKSELRSPYLVTRHGSTATIKTSDIGMVYYRKSGTIAGPIATGVIGGILGAVGSAYLIHNTEEVGTGLLVFAAGTAGGASGGALLGREIVKKTVTIYVTPARR